MHAMHPYMYAHQHLMSLAPVCRSHVPLIRHIGSCRMPAGLSPTERTETLDCYYVPKQPWRCHSVSSGHTRRRPCVCRKVFLQLFFLLMCLSSARFRNTYMCYPFIQRRIERKASTIHIQPGYCGACSMWNLASKEKNTSQ